MEKSVEALEAMFQKADSDLNYLSRKVEFELENSSENGETPNPARMLEKISDIKKEFSSISQDAIEIQKTQKEMRLAQKFQAMQPSSDDSKEAMDYFRSQLLSACQMVEKLSQQTGVENSEPPPELSELSSLLNFDLSSIQQSSSSQGQSSTLQSTSSYDPTPPTEPVRELTASELRNQSNDYLDVTEDEFLSVSELVRGRVKLHDVNSVYQVLWKYFKEEKNKKPLKTTDLHKMGCKVSGATGEAKLKVLRALKLIQLSNKGEVTMT